MDSPVAWLLIGVLIIGVVVIVLYVVDSNKPEIPNNSTNLTQNLTYFTFYIESNNLETVNYKLDNGTDVLMQGLLFSGVIEEYTPMVVNGSILNLSIWSDKYYFNQSLCNISTNQSHCRTTVFKKALDYSILISNESLTFNLSEGMVQSPIICFFWESNVLNVRIPFNRTPIPSDLRDNSSICYQSPSIFNSTEIPVDVHFRPTSNESGNLFVYVKDFEIGGLSNIGFRVGGLEIQKQ